MRACRFALAILVAAVLLAGAMGAAGPARAQDDAELGALSNDVQRLSEAGKYQEATAVAERYVEIARKRGENSAEFATAIGWLAQVLKDTNRLAEAEPLMRRALAIDEMNFAPAHPNVARDLNNLAQVLHVTNRLAEAEPLYRRALAINEQTFGSKHADVATSLNNLAQLLQDTDRLAEAEPLYRRALAIDEMNFGSAHPNVARDLNNLATLLHLTDRLAEAEPLYRRVLSLFETILGPGHPNVAFGLNNLAQLLKDTNRLAEAEPLMRRALAIDEMSLGPEHPNVARDLNSLATLLYAANQLAEAEPLMRRALAIDEKSFGPAHPNVARGLNNLAELLRGVDRLAEAEPLYRRALAIWEKSLGPDHPNVAYGLNNLGLLLQATNRFTEAEPLIRRALAIDEKSLGPEHPNVAVRLNNLAQLLRDTNRLVEAEPLYRRVVTIFEKSLGPDHPNVAIGLNNLAVLNAELGDWAQAASLHRRAKPIMTDARSRSDGDDRANLARVTLAANALALRVSARAVYRADAQSTEGFELAQWALQTGAADALAQMSVRFAKGGGPLAQIVREQQDLISRRKGEDKRLLAAVGAADSKVAEAMRASIAGLDAKLDAIDKRLAAEFPEYASLANPKPLTVAAVQALLKADEALLLFLDVPGLTLLPEETLAWAITKTDARWISTPLGTAALGERVARLRCGLDREGLWSWSGVNQRWEANSAACRALAPDGLAADAPLPFDMGTAHELYQVLLAPLADLTSGKSLIIVPSGPLTSLPFHVLLTAPSPRLRREGGGEGQKQTPSSAQASAPHPNPLPMKYGEREYRGAAWLALKQPVTVLPSVGSLQALRKLPPSDAKEPYIAFGNPLLDGSGSPADKARADQARAKQRCPQDLEALRQRVVAAAKGVPALATFFRGGSVDLASLRAQAPLPETADELCAVAKALGALGREADTVWLGARATEANLKALSREGKLARHRVLHFATHGFLAGETETILNSKAEPALVLTPPKDGATPAELEQDDGLLTASEVAQLELDADWVVLSACNTAAGDKGDAEALSGLARAFFYAKARALLVSHWYVASDAAVKLTTGAFAELAANPAIGRAEALRRSMAALITKGTPQEAHPSAWAPFVLVGEGGR